MSWFCGPSKGDQYFSIQVAEIWLWTTVPKSWLCLFIYFIQKALKFLCDSASPEDGGVARLEGNVHNSSRHLWVGERGRSLLWPWSVRGRKPALGISLGSSAKVLGKVRFKNIKWFNCNNNGKRLGCWKNKGISAFQTQFHAERSGHYSEYDMTPEVDWGKPFSG